MKNRWLVTVVCAIGTVVAGCDDHSSPKNRDEKEQWTPPIPVAATIGVPARPVCGGPPYYCPMTMDCAGADKCGVTECGTGHCPTCVVPGFDNLMISAWCSYTCYRDDKPVSSAYALMPSIMPAARNMKKPFTAECLPPDR